jgi:hypothetical protein
MNIVKMDLKTYSKQVIVLFGVSLLFILPLINAWLHYPLGMESLQTQYSALGGSLPWGDANGYYAGANRFLEEGVLDAWNTRRPLNAILFALRLWLSGYNLQIALIIQAILCGISSFLVTNLIAKSYNRVAGWVAFVILFLFASIFIPTTLSETLGLTLGCLSFVLLWQAVNTSKQKLMLAAGCLLMVGLNARAGAFFVLPLLGLWLLLSPNQNQSKINWKAALAFISGVFIAFIFNYLLSHLYGDANGNGAAHSNFSFTLYGLVSGGKSWAYALSAFPSLVKDSEAEVAHFLYLESWKLFKESPHLLALGILKSFGGALNALISFFIQLPENILFLKIFIRTIGIIALFFSIKRLKLIYKHNPRITGMLLITFLGVITSSFIIWTDGGARVFAVTVPFYAALVGLVIGSLFENKWQTLRQAAYDTQRDTNNINLITNFAYTLGLVLLLSALIGPKLIGKNPHFNSIVTFTCPANQTPIIVRYINKVPSLYLSPPAVQYQKNILNAACESKAELLRLSEPDLLNEKKVLALVYDIKAAHPKYVFGPAYFFEPKEQKNLTGFCSAPLSGSTLIHTLIFHEVLDEK